MYTHTLNERYGIMLCGTQRVNDVISCDFRRHQSLSSFRRRCRHRRRRLYRPWYHRKMNYGKQFQNVINIEGIKEGTKKSKI